jgi:hypothetical protein
MPYVRFEPTIPASERAKTVNALDRAATVIDLETHDSELLDFCTFPVVRFRKLDLFPSSDEDGKNLLCWGPSKELTQ